jgi:hypothetical protein
MLFAVLFADTQDYASKNPIETPTVWRCKVYNTRKYLITDT